MLEDFNSGLQRPLVQEREFFSGNCNQNDSDKEFYPTASSPLLKDFHVANKKDYHSIDAYNYRNLKSGSNHGNNERYQNRSRINQEGERFHKIKILELSSLEPSFLSKDVTLRSLLQEIQEEVESIESESHLDDENFPSDADILTALTCTPPPTAVSLPMSKSLSISYAMSPKLKNLFTMDAGALTYKSHTGLPHKGRHRGEFATIELNIRDLRRMDFSVNPNKELNILVRKHVVLFSVCELRAIVMANKVRLISAPGAEQSATTLCGYLQDWFFYDPDRWCDSYDPLDLYGSRSPVRKTVILHNLRSDFESNEDNQPRDTSIHHAYNSPSMSPSRPIPIPHSPATSHSNSSRSVKTTSEIQSLSSSFELHIYTSILTTVNNELLNQCRNLSFKTEKILDYFRVGSGISLYVHDMLLLLQTDINRLKSALTQCYSSLDVLLTDIEAMTLMNLSPLCKDPSLYRYPLSHSLLTQHTEIEEALELYLADFASLETHLDFLLAQLTYAEAEAFFKVDVLQNRVLVANTVLNVVTTCVTFGGYIATAYGMNLDNVKSIQYIPGYFWSVFVVTIFLIFFGSIALYWLYIKAEVIQGLYKDVNVLKVLESDNKSSDRYDYFDKLEEIAQSVSRSMSSNHDDANHMYRDDRFARRNIQNYSGREHHAYHRHLSQLPINHDASEVILNPLHTTNHQNY